MTILSLAILSITTLSPYLLPPATPPICITIRLPALPPSLPACLPPPPSRPLAPVLLELPLKHVLFHHDFIAVINAATRRYISAGRLHLLHRDLFLPSAVSGRPSPQPPAPPSFAASPACTPFGLPCLSEGKGKPQHRDLSERRPAVVVTRPSMTNI